MSGFSSTFLESLSRISQNATPPDQPDPLSKAQEDELAKIKAEYYRKNQDAYLENYKQDMEMRKDYADRIYTMLAFWLFFTGATLLLVSMNKLKLSENVLIALLTTSSANVIAIFIYVVKYLYAKPGIPEDPTK